VTLTIAKDGSIENFSLQENAPAWMQQLSQCILDRIDFVPGTSKGKAVKARAELLLNFANGDGLELGTIQVLTVGPLITAPHLLGRPGHVLENCLPRNSPSSGVSRIVIETTITPDGRIANVDVPVGSPAWVEIAARCLQKRLKFAPGTRDGYPVEAQAKIPITLHNESLPPGNVTEPKPPTDREEVEAAYRECYPPDLAAMESIYYSFDVDTEGRTSNVKVVRGSGDERLDQAGVCIVSKLRFSPLMHGDTALKSKITWELPIRPPR
jgi:TonB family protein